MSLSRSEQARINGAKSQGPVTPEGKARSSQNAIKHGAASKALVLQNENPALLDTLKDAYKVRFEPDDQVELDLVMEMVAARWRMARLWGMETALFDLEMDDQAPAIEEKYTRIDEQTRQALAFKALAQDNSLELAQRYETRFRRAYDRALANLLKLQDRRQKQNLPNEPKPGAPDAPSTSLPNEPEAVLSPGEADLPSFPPNEPKTPQTGPRPQGSDLPTFRPSDLPAFRSSDFAVQWRPQL